MAWGKTVGSEKLILYMCVFVYFLKRRTSFIKQVTKRKRKIKENENEKDKSAPVGDGPLRVSPESESAGANQLLCSSTSTGKFVQKLLLDLLFSVHRGFCTAPVCASPSFRANSNSTESTQLPLQLNLSRLAAVNSPPVSKSSQEEAKESRFPVSAQLLPHPGFPAGGGSSAKEEDL